MRPIRMKAALQAASPHATQSGIWIFPAKRDWILIYLGGALWLSQH